MNTQVPMHSPTPEFRASLEREIVRALREDQLELPPSITQRRRRRWRTTITLGLGLLLGAGTQFASAQVEQARTQSELERVKRAEFEVAALRLELARAQVAESEKAREAGRLSSPDVIGARLGVRTAELRLAQLQSELKEIRLTSTAPRDELWAPLVGSEDFVRERLTMKAAAAQERLAAAEKSVEEFQRGFNVGFGTRERDADVRRELIDAKLGFDQLAVLVMLRDQFIKERLSAEQLARRRERLESTVELQGAMRQLELAEARLEMVRKAHAAGAALLIDVKRAELDVLEIQVQAQRLQERLKALGAGRPE